MTTVETLVTVIDALLSDVEAGGWWATVDLRRR
jgi:hypothetical protein